MKFIKGIAIFLVLCLATYGAYTLFKRPPQIEIPENDRVTLQNLGVDVQDGQAADSGLSAIFGNVEGVAPGSSFGMTGSSTPPSFLAAPTTSYTPPPFMETPLRVAAVHAESQQPVSESFQPIGEVLPPPNFSDPVDFPVEMPPIGVPPIEVTPEMPSFDAPPLEVLTPPSETPSIPAAESPPPWIESWDGPASDIPVTPPPSESLQTLNPSFSLSPIADTSTNTFLPIHEKTVYQSGGENIRKIKEDIRKIASVSATAPARPEGSENQTSAFSSSDSVPLDAALVSNMRYTLTSSRQPLTFEPVKTEVPPNAPVLTFAPPKQTTQPQQPQPSQPLQQPVAASSIVAVNPAAINPVAPNPVAPSVRQIGTARLIENAVSPPAPAPVQSPIRETIERFIQTQQQLAESGDLDNIRQAFAQLSQLYENNKLEDLERARMYPMLDALALQVIYARGTHILEPSYRVKPGETVESIAQQFKLTPALLRKINGLAMTSELPAGTTLKVVHGQFDARISFQRKELTLLLGGLYAGRFSFSVPNDNILARKGEFFVTKRADRMVTLNNGWILATDYARDATIVFADKDAREIFDILSEQSVVVVE